MPEDGFAEVGAHRRQFALVAASAASVVLVAVAILGVRTWVAAPARGPVAGGTPAAIPSASVFASSVSTAAAVSASDPAFSSSPMVSPAPVSSPPSQPSPHSSATSRRTPPGAPAVVDESHLNFEVSMRLSPTHVLLGQQTRVTVTIRNGGHGIDPAAEVSIGSMVPADDFSDAPPDCVIANGGVQCPVPVLRAGGEKTIAFTVTTGYYPGASWDDEIFGQLGYADSYGQQQQLQPGYSADLTVDAGTLSSAPAGSGAPSTAPSPPPTSAAPSTPDPPTPTHTHTVACRLSLQRSTLSLVRQPTGPHSRLPGRPQEGSCAERRVCRRSRAPWPVRPHRCERSERRCRGGSCRAGRAPMA